MSINKNQKINPFSYWVIPDHLVAGEYPGNQFSKNIKTFSGTILHLINAIFKSKKFIWNSAQKKIGNLLDLGVVVFVDLTEQGERISYQPILHKERRRRAVSTQHIRFPVTDRSVPLVEEMKEILDFIDSEIQSKKIVYLHCFRGLGRTGTTIGCYLVRHGLSGEEALNKIGELRNNVAGNFRDSPETEEQKTFVLNWKE
ncbi:MAG: dual specificity protein phosphatase family protein [Dehalococcoidia bacterium]